MDPSFALFSCFVFLSYFSMVFAGFGGVIIALTLGAHLYPIQWMLPILLPLTLAANLYIFIRHRRFIDRAVLVERILPFMAPGLVVGFVLLHVIYGDMLRAVFGITVVLVAARELVTLVGSGHQPAAAIPAWRSNGTVFAAGVIHGIYVSGGPLLVYAVNRMGLTKSAFRSTLSIVWLIMNIFLTGAYVMAGQINVTTLTTSAYLLPVLIISTVLGETMHHRIPERYFKMAVFMLLALSGVAITVK